MARENWERAIKLSKDKKEKTKIEERIKSLEGK
jgi:predicted RNA polymerase sigma factor